MGMDIYSESGIIAGIDEMLGMLRKSDVKKALAALKKWFEEVDSKNFWTMSEKPFDEFFANLKALTESKTTSLEDLKSELESCCVVNGEPTKYGSDDCFVHHQEALCQIWNEIINATRPELPELAQVTVFDSGRVNGWDVPHGVACFIFNSGDCFEKRLTETGKALKKAIGHCSETEWTIMSV